MMPPGPRGPGGVFSAYFRAILGHFWPIFFPPISPLGALFLGPLLALLRAAALWGAPPVQFTLVDSDERNPGVAALAAALFR